MNKNTPGIKGIRTFLQAVPGFVIGLMVTLWMDDSARQLIINYVRDSGPQLLLLLGINVSVFTGLFSFGQNKVEDKSQ